MRYICDQQIKTATGSDSGSYDITTGICSSTRNQCNDTNTHYGDYNLCGNNGLGPCNNNQNIPLQSDGRMIAAYGVIVPRTMTTLKSCGQKEGMDILDIVLGGDFFSNYFGSLAATNGRSLGNFFFTPAIQNIAGKLNGPNGGFNLASAVIVSGYAAARFELAAVNLATKVGSNIFDSFVHLNKMVWAKVSEGIAHKLGNTEGAKIFGCVVAAIVLGLMDLEFAVFGGGIIATSAVLKYTGGYVAIAISATINAIVAALNANNAAAGQVALTVASAVANPSSGGHGGGSWRSGWS
jgi:hypothetical protein